MAGNKSSSKSTTTQSVEPWLKDQFENSYNRIKDLDAYEGYDGDAIAGLTPEMKQQLEAMKQQGQQGQGAIDQGLGALGDVAGTQADQIAPGELDIEKYQNPYQQQVIDQTMQGIDRQRQMAIGQGEDAAIGSGAYGGSRHGVADAETNRGFGEVSAKALAGLNQQGFNTSLGAAQQQQGVDLRAQQANQSAGLDSDRLNLLAGQGLLGTGQGLFSQGNAAAQFGQDRAQGQADFDYQDYMQEFMDPRQLAQMQASALTGAPSNTTTTQTQPGGSRLGAGLGGAASGAGLGLQLGGAGLGFGKGTGAAVGAGLGALGGMFG